ncbi:MAG: MATE family efflux transporter [Pseudomonadota bacterium]
MDPLGHHLKRTLVLGLPLIGSQIAQVMIGLTDTLMLGRYSIEALAAATLGSTYFFTIFLLGSGFAFAIAPLSAEAVGREDETRVRRVARMGLWLAVLFGVICLPLFLFARPILTALGQQPEVATDATLYLQVSGWGMVFALLTATLRSHLSALERTRIVLIATLSAVALNVGLNWLFIFGNLGAPELGVRGAALASVGVHILSAGILLLYATRGPGMARFELLRNIGRPDWPIFAEIARLGWPISLTHVSESGLFAASALMMGWLGTVPLAAHGIAVQIAAATFMIHLGLASAATVRVGQAWGRGEAVNLRRAAGAAGLLSAVAAFASIVMYIGAGEWLVGLFLSADDPDAPAILTLGMALLVLAAAFQAVDAAQVMGLGFLRGMQDTRVPMVYAIIAYWGLGIPVSYLLGFPLGFGAEGIWIGLVVGLAGIAVAANLRFLRRVPVQPIT